MKGSLLNLVFLFSALSAKADPAEFFSASFNGQSLGQAVSFYDDDEGDLILRFATEQEVEVNQVRWSLVVGDLVAPLGQPVKPNGIEWKSPFTEISVEISAREIPAQQTQLLELFAGGVRIGPPLSIQVFPAEERRSLIKRLSENRLFLDSRLESISDLFDRYRLRYQDFIASRSIRTASSGLTFLLEEGAPPSGPTSRVFIFAPRSTGIPVLRVEGNRARFSYMDALSLTGNAAMEMLIFQTAVDLNNTVPNQNQPNIRNEEPLF
ncbi:MAG: hypothetical protein AAGJ81_03945 [Verrucomicrobiota bacterium]